jgi:hypothetical protein
MNPADRAAAVRRDIERRFGRALSEVADLLKDLEFFERLEDIIGEALDEQRINDRRKWEAGE